ncbi:MAG: cell division FtsZ family protein, partial [Alistipes sp.]|nr:cell division FtsZ family protein [Alistipes sp.]
MNELSMPKQSNSIITVIGVGGAGGNALNYMWKMGIKDVNFLACNTDQRALDNLDIPKENKIVMGPGLGAGNDPEEGRRLATESIDLIKQHLEANDTKMVFIAAGMGGGTGTGASPVIAKLTHEMDILTVANVASPLLWEGPTRYDQAQRGIEELRKYVDSLLVIDNESIIEQFGNLPMSKAFSKADDILASATKGIAEIITVESAFIRVDYADLRRVMKGSGRAHMGVATAEGEDRAREAARRSLCSPLLNSNLISGAKKILLSIAAANVDDISYKEAMEVLR